VGVLLKPGRSSSRRGLREAKRRAGVALDSHRPLHQGIPSLPANPGEEFLASVASPRHYGANTELELHLRMRLRCVRTERWTRVRHAVLRRGYMESVIESFKDKRGFDSHPQAGEVL